MRPDCNENFRPCTKTVRSYNPGAAGGPPQEKYFLCADRVYFQVPICSFSVFDQC